MQVQYYRLSLFIARINSRIKMMLAFFPVSIESMEVGDRGGDGPDTGYAILFINQSVEKSLLAGCSSDDMTKFRRGGQESRVLAFSSSARAPSVLSSLRPES